MTALAESESLANVPRLPGLKEEYYEDSEVQNALIQLI